MADNNSFASNSFFAHGRKWGGSLTYCELQDSPVVVDPVANSGGADEKKVKKPRGPFKKKEKQSVNEQYLVIFVIS